MIIPTFVGDEVIVSARPRATDCAGRAENRVTASPARRNGTLSASAAGVEVIDCVIPPLVGASGLHVTPAPCLRTVLVQRNDGTGLPRVWMLLLVSSGIGEGQCVQP